MPAASNSYRLQSATNTARRSHNQGLGRFSDALKELEITEEIPGSVRTADRYLTRVAPKPNKSEVRQTVWYSLPFPQISRKEDTHLSFKGI